MVSALLHLPQIFHLPALLKFFGLSILSVVSSIELLPYLCLRSLFNQYCLRLSPFLLLKKGVISVFFYGFCAGASTRGRSSCYRNCANRSVSLIPAITLLFTRSPFTISYLQCSVKLTRVIKAASSWTWYLLLHLTLSYILSFLPMKWASKAYLCCNLFLSLAVSEHIAYHYKNNSDKQENLLFLGCSLLK